MKDFIVGNEPNVNRFWQPQYAGGKDAAATDYEHTLAQSYDALKTVRPDSIVWGPAISSRGNDNANAASNPSHSPVWFIKYMGDAYKASGRTKPIFDEFDLHPYPPIQDTDPFTKPFQWPQAGAANLDRIKQALWDAFNGTGQPTVTEQSGGATAAFAAPQSLPIDMDEAGEQTVVTGHEPAYDGTPENVVPISEAQQSTNHVELAEIGACDPAVKTVLYFPLIDDTGISTGFQSGNLFADFVKKQSYAGMKAKIASAKGNCQGGVTGSRNVGAHRAGDRRAGHLRRPRHQPGLAADRQAGRHDGRLDEPHRQRRRDLRGDALAGHRPIRWRREDDRVADGHGQGVLQARAELQGVQAAGGGLLPVRDRAEGCDEPVADDDPDVEDVQGRHAGRLDEQAHEGQAKAHKARSPSQSRSRRPARRASRRTPGQCVKKVTPRFAGSRAPRGAPAIWLHSTLH